MLDYMIPIVERGYKFVNLRSTVEVIYWVTPRCFSLKYATKSSANFFSESFLVGYSAFCRGLILSVFPCFMKVETEPTFVRCGQNIDSWNI